MVKGSHVLFIAEDGVQRERPGHQALPGVLQACGSQLSRACTLHSREVFGLSATSASAHISEETNGRKTAAP